MGLLSGEYSQKPPIEEQPPSKGDDAGGDKLKQKEQLGIRPLIFKTLIGTGHREFSSNRQQVHVYTVILIDIMIQVIQPLCTSWFNNTLR